MSPAYPYIQYLVVFAPLTVAHLFGHRTIALRKALPLEVKFLAGVITYFKCRNTASHVYQP